MNIAAVFEENPTNADGWNDLVEFKVMPDGEA